MSPRRISSIKIAVGLAALVIGFAIVSALPATAMTRGEVRLECVKSAFVRIGSGKEWRARLDQCMWQRRSEYRVPRYWRS